MSEESKKCPMCGENILAVAKKCKHCGEIIKNAQNNDKANYVSKWTVFFTIGGALFLLIMAFAMIGSNSGQKTNSRSISQEKLASTRPAKPKLSQDEIQRRADNQILKQIWRDYHNLPGNRGADDRSEKGRIIKRGTVPPSAMNSSVGGRLPAYLACYDYISVFSMGGMTGDSKANMCIYHVNNPTMSRSSMAWRGKIYIEKLEEIMRNDGFKEK